MPTKMPRANTLCAACGKRADQHHVWGACGVGSDTFTSSDSYDQEVDQAMTDNERENLQDTINNLRAQVARHNLLFSRSMAIYDLCSAGHLRFQAGEGAPVETYATAADFLQSVKDLRA